MGRSGHSRRRADRKWEEAGRDGAKLATEASASKIYLESTTSSTDFYVRSVEQNQCAQKANVNESNIPGQSGSSKDSYAWSGQRDATAAAGNASATGSGTAASLRKRPAQMNLSNAAKQSMNLGVASSRNERLVSAVLERKRAPYRGPPSQAEPAPAPRSVVPGRARAPYVMAPAKPSTSTLAAPVKLTADTLAKVTQEISDIPMPENGPHIWNAGHDKDQKEHRPTSVRPEKPPPEWLCIDALEGAIIQGKTKVDARLVAKAVEHYQDRVETLELMVAGSRGEVVQAMKAMKQEIEALKKENQKCRTLVHDKASKEGWLHQVDKALEVVDIVRLREEAETLREENEEKKQNYAELEAEKRTDEEMHELDQALIDDYKREEKKKDERTEKLKEELMRAKKEIDFAGFQSRPKVRNSINRSEINRFESSESTVGSDDSTLNGSHTGSHVSNASDASTDTTVSTANANIHLLEMSIAHSKKKFTEASGAAAKAEKYLCCLDAKTQLAVKAWHASNVALSDSEDNDNLELAKRLFEDALFIAQGMKNDKGGKTYEDKCKAWLSHLADMEAKRSASACSSRETSKKRLGTGKENKGFVQYDENKRAPHRQHMAMGEEASAEECCSGGKPGTTSIAITATDFAAATRGLHFYSPSNSNATSNSNRSSQELGLPVLPPQPLRAQLDAAHEQPFTPPPSSPLDPASPSSPGRRHSSQDWPTKLSRSLADELSGLNSSFTATTSSTRSLVSEHSDCSRSCSESWDSQRWEAVWRPRLPQRDMVTDVDLDEFSPNNALDIHFDSSRSGNTRSEESPEQSPQGTVEQGGIQVEDQNQDTEARPMSVG